MAVLETRVSKLQKNIETVNEVVIQAQATIHAAADNERKDAIQQIKGAVPGIVSGNVSKQLAEDISKLLSIDLAPAESSPWLVSDIDKPKFEGSKIEVALQCPTGQVLTEWHYGKLNKDFKAGCSKLSISAK